MLIIQTPPAAEAEWAEQGWPAVLPAGHEQAAPPELLGWAMRTVSPAVHAGDWPVVEDLVDEGNLWLTQVRAAHYKDPDPALKPFLSITDSLWPEVQRAVGAQDVERLSYATRLLSKLCGVADVIGPRPAPAVWAYVPPADRPFLTAAGPSRPGPAGQFLADLAAGLSNQLGHLVDAGNPLRPPPGRPLLAMGWRSSIEPQGPALGSLDLDQATLRLRATTISQVLERSSVGEVANTEPAAIGAALAEAWLIDTTLIVDANGYRRLHGVVDACWDGGAPELIWRLPDVMASGSGRWGAALRR